MDESLHIEATSKCTLECPLCDRTWFYKKFKKRLLQEINVKDLIKFAGQNRKIHFCGNNGDPIYHSQFIDLVAGLKQNKCQIFITTNGSAKTETWWASLNKLLDKNDQITLSIDGLEDTNHVYRRNAKWQSIMQAIKVLQNRKAKLKWKFIVFKHNQNQIEEARKISLMLGFDEFTIEKSDRWLDEKTLMPDEKYVNDYHKHQKSILTNPDYSTKMEPWCLKKNIPSRSLYIDAEGNFYPCCWMGTYRYRYKSVFSPKQNKFNISKMTLESILQMEKVKQFFESTKQFTSAHECCKI